MGRAYLQALAQLGDPALPRLILTVLAVGALLSVAIMVAGGALLAATTTVGLPWLEAVLDVAGGLASVVLAILLFPALAGLVACLMLEPVAAATESRHFGGLGPPRAAPWWEGLWLALRFALTLIALNLMALPAYLLLPGVNLLIYLALNGYLLGREYFEFAALRRMPRAEARRLWRRHRFEAIMGGVLLALQAAVPGANLLLPIVGTATFVLWVAARTGLRA